MVVWFLASVGMQVLAGVNVDRDGPLAASATVNQVHRLPLGQSFVAIVGLSIVAWAVPISIIAALTTIF